MQYLCIYIYAYMGMYLCITNPKKNSEFCMKLCSGVWMRDGACLGMFRAVHEISQAPVTHVRMLRLEPRLDSVSPPFHRIQPPATFLVPALKQQQTPHHPSQPAAWGVAVLGSPSKGPEAEARE